MCESQKKVQRHYIGAYSYKNHACLTTICYELLYQISWDVANSSVSDTRSQMEMSVAST